MIVYDDPMRRQVRGGRRAGEVHVTAHLASTLRGARGTEELVAFATKIGLQAGWLQHGGEWNEHFDLIGQAVVDQAHAAGAQLVTRGELIGYLRRKRRGRGRGSSG